MLLNLADGLTDAPRRKHSTRCCYAYANSRAVIFVALLAGMRFAANFARPFKIGARASEVDQLLD